MRVVSVLLVAAILIPNKARAQSAGPLPAPYTLDGAERYTLTGSKNRQSYQIDIYRVNSTAAPMPADAALPVIYILDGNSLFPLAAHIANAIATFSTQIPGALVVAIGYPATPALSRGENIKNALAWRNRDLSPPFRSGKPTPPGSGGAAEFLAFINEDLKPFVVARYPVNRAEQTLVGHSLGGLFTVFALLTDPASFARYVAASPSVFWDDNAMIAQARTFSERFPGVSKRLFVSVGGQETKAFMGEDMIGVARSLVEAFQTQKPAGVDATFRLFPEENHISVVPAALMRGLLEVGALR